MNDEIISKLQNMGNELKDLIKDSVDLISGYNIASKSEYDACKNNISLLPAILKLLTQMTDNFKVGTDKCISMFDEKVDLFKASLQPIRTTNDDKNKNNLLNCRKSCNNISINQYNLPIMQDFDKKSEILMEKNEKNEIDKTGKEQQNKESEWTLIQYKKQLKNNNDKELDKPKQVEKIDRISNNIIINGTELSVIPITNNIGISAIVVDSINKIPEMPIYYNSTTGEFVLKFIGGKVIRGNCGVIYQTSKTPHSIPCSYGIECRRPTCSYYHDPEIVKNSKDIMNWSFNDVKYNENMTNNANFLGWKYGSKNHIEEDLNSRLKSDEAYRYMKLTMHYLITGLAILYNTDLIK